MLIDPVPMLAFDFPENVPGSIFKAEAPPAASNFRGQACVLRAGPNLQGRGCRLHGRGGHLPALRGCLRGGTFIFGASVLDSRGEVVCLWGKVRTFSNNQQPENMQPAPSDEHPARKINTTSEYIHPLPLKGTPST